MQGLVRVDATETSYTTDGSSIMSHVEPFLSGIQLDLVGLQRTTSMGGELEYLVTLVEGGRRSVRTKINFVTNILQPWNQPHR